MIGDSFPTYYIDKNSAFYNVDLASLMTETKWHALFSYITISNLTIRIINERSHFTNPSGCMKFKKQ